MPLAELTGLDIAGIVRHWTVALQLALSLTLFAAVLVKAPLGMRVQRWLAVAAGGAFVAGCALLYVPAGAFGIILSGVLVGLGQGAFLLLWQRRFALLGADAVSKLPFLALALSSGAYLLLAGLPKSLVCPAAMASACVSALLFAMVPCGAPPHGSMSKAVPYAPFDADMVARDLKNPIICVAAMAAAVLLTRFVALGSAADPDTVNISANAGILVIAAALYLVRFGFGKGEAQDGSQGILLVYHVAFPVVATALLVLLLGGAALATSVAALAYAGFAVLAVTLMSASVAIAREHDARSEQIYGVLLGSMYLACTAVTALGDVWLFQLDASADKAVAVVSVLTLYVLAISLFFIHGIPGRGRVCHEGAVAETPSAAAASPAPAEGVEEVCTRLGESGELTERERDILVLIVKGRDAPSIAKQLGISINTVRSHSKSIYRKLGVHSKQELLDRAEAEGRGHPKTPGGARA